LVELQEALSGAIATARAAVVAIQARHGPPGAPPVESTGAGVIVDPRGLVVTNHHVIAGATEIEVVVWRRGAPRFFARVVAADPGQDLALLAIWGRGPFPTAVLGDSRLVQVGDRVIAIGTPLGLAHSASLGIVSDEARTLTIGGRTYPAMLQTDATINQGNSGGPLLNLRGEVIGIATAIFAPAGTSTGVAFAIPSGRVRAFVAEARRGPAARLAAFEREPIRIGQPRPHPFTTSCTECHSIRGRLPISMAQDMPHAYVGDCATCHTFTDTAAAGAPGPVPPPAVTAGGAAPASYRLATEFRPSGAVVDRRSRSTVQGLLLTLSAVVVAAGGAWLWIRRARA
jgi:S1-C subfamily serine protease